MTGTKPIWVSKAVWGGVVALLAAMLSLFNIAVSPSDQVSLIEALTSIATAGGALLAIYGRVTAQKVLE